MPAIPISIYLIALMAVTCYSTLTILAKKAVLGIPPFAFMTVSMIILTLLSGLASLATERKTVEVSTIVSNLPLITLFAAVNFLGFALYLYSLSKMPVAQYQTIYLVSPLIVGLLGMIFLAEPYHWKYLIGLVLTSCGLLIVIDPWKVFK